MNIYQSCVQIDSCSLVINTNIGDEKECLAPCCTSMINIGCELTDDPSKAIDELIRIRNEIIEENKRVYQTDNKERIYTTNCVDCTSYIVRKWTNVESKIGYVNLSMTPAPCQSKCIYCNPRKIKYILTDKSKDAYSKLFQLIKYIKDKNMMADDIHFDVSSGEISIHPYKKLIFELMHDTNVTFFSNCFIFSQDLANLLESNRRAKINLSIDSGTALTWKKVKGYNNFNVAVNNLYKYYQYCDQINYQQIELKYIILPGVNTRIQDYKGVIEIMKKLSIKKIFISRNFNDNYYPSSPEYMELFDHIINFALLCISSGLSFSLANGFYTEDEQKYVDTTIKQKIKNDKIL